MKRFVFVFFFSWLALAVQGGTSDPILTIGEETFESGEFWYIYHKNQHLTGFSESPEAFADRFINYKLKVIEARKQGFDTLSTFKREFARYENELTKAFLVDSAALDALVVQAHRNMQGLVEASHILVEVAEDAVPADTLLAWNRINAVRAQALSGGDFNELAERYSMDPSAKDNRGYLGYFSAFRMIYPFEAAAFSTPIDALSPIFRTRFGYHIIKVHDRRPNPGKIRVAHIMKMFATPGASVGSEQQEADIRALHRQVIGGASFENLAREHSEDQSSAAQGGELPVFGWGEMVPEFAQAAFALPADGDVSAPVRTNFGWHIIKRLEVQPVGSLEEEYSYIMRMLKREGLLDAMVSDSALSAQKELLMETNDDYRYLVQEYYDGLLIFEISSKEIWNEQENDSLALREYYKEHLNEFSPAPQMTGTVCAVNSTKLEHRVKKRLRKEGNQADVVQILKDSARRTDDFVCKSGQFAFVENASNPLDVAALPENSELRVLGDVLYWEGSVQESAPSSYEEVAGEVLRIYQNRKEEIWVRDLRERYQPQFNYRLLKKVN